MRGQKNAFRSGRSALRGSHLENTSGSHAPPTARDVTTAVCTAQRRRHARTRALPRRPECLGSMTGSTWKHAAAVVSASLRGPRRSVCALLSPGFPPRHVLSPTDPVTRAERARKVEACVFLNMCEGGFSLPFFPQESECKNKWLKYCVVTWIFIFCPAENGRSLAKMKMDEYSLEKQQRNFENTPLWAASNGSGAQQTFPSLWERKTGEGNT